MAKTRIVRNVGRPTLVQEAITIYLDRISNDIKKDQEDKKLVATGDSLNSHVITINRTNTTFSAAGYYPFIVEGRGPGKFPPPPKILDWINVRNITPDDPNMTIKQLAFLIGRKQAREGSAIFRGEREGIDFLEIATKNEGVLYRQVGKAIADQVTDTLLDTFSKNPNYEIL